MTLLDLISEVNSQNELDKIVRENIVFFTNSKTFQKLVHIKRCFLIESGSVI